MAGSTGLSVKFPQGLSGQVNLGQCVPKLGRKFPGPPSLDFNLASSLGLLC